MKTFNWHIEKSLSYGWAGGLYFVIGGIALIVLEIKRYTAK